MYTLGVPPAHLEKGMESGEGLVAAVEGLLAHLKEVDKGRVHSQEVIRLGEREQRDIAYPGDLIGRAEPHLLQ